MKVVIIQIGKIGKHWLTLANIGKHWQTLAHLFENK
jgi:hypothetical protein